MHAAQGDVLAFDSAIAAMRREEAMQARIEFWLQVMIPAMTLAGLYLALRQDAALRIAGYWISFAAQPLFFAESWLSRKYGYALLALAFGAVWGEAILTTWRSP